MSACRWLSAYNAGDDNEARHRRWLDSVAGRGGEAAGCRIASRARLGPRVPGQQHILARSWRSGLRTRCRLRACAWLVIVGAARRGVVGLAGAAIISPPLEGSDSEKGVHQMATTTASVLRPLPVGHPRGDQSMRRRRLLVAFLRVRAGLRTRGCSVAEAGRASWLWGSEDAGAVLGIALLALPARAQSENKVLEPVLGRGRLRRLRSGPRSCCRCTGRDEPQRRARRMLVGGLTVILWKQGSGGIFELYEMVPGVVLSSLRDLGGVRFAKICKIREVVPPR